MVDPGDIAVSIGLRVVEGAAEKIFEKLIEKLVEDLSRSGATASVLYFTLLEPKVTAGAVESFAKRVYGTGVLVDVKEVPVGRLLRVGKSHFALTFYVTRLGDILFYDALYSELVDALESGEGSPEVPLDDELAEELGVDRELIDRVSDVTVTVLPWDKPRAEDVHQLISSIYSIAVQELFTDRAVLKIRIFGKGEETVKLKSRLERLGVRVYRSERSEGTVVLTVVLLTPPQILDPRVYRTIYGGIGFISSLKHR